jgi:hypothetical protein
MRSQVLHAYKIMDKNVADLLQELIATTFRVEDFSHEDGGRKFLRNWQHIPLPHDAKFQKQNQK